jgi:small-conductance mechanosensitive channel
MNPTDWVGADALATARDLGLSALLFAALILGLLLAHRRTKSYYKDRPNQQFRRQLIMLGLTVFAILLVIILLPIDNELRGQLLSLFGIVVSATIALSSTTLVGNAMAFIMLRTIESCRPGDYIQVGEHFGRISEMDLLHTEIQTEDRDLTTIPNLYMVTHPIKTLRKSGTILSVEVSLGYDVPRHEIERLLKTAAEKTGLESPFVQIRALGDFSVSYGVAGLLTDLQSLIQKRRQLRAATMDVLHEAGVEIASPYILSVREFPPNSSFVPKPASKADVATEESGARPDDLVFDKANQAENIANMRQDHEQCVKDMEAIDAKLKEKPSDEESARLTAERQRLEQKDKWITRQVERLESNIAQE